MKSSRGAKAAGIIVLSAFILAGASTLRAQFRASPSSTLDLSALQLVDSNAIPASGNFYFAQNYGITHAAGIMAFGPPLPGDLRPDLPLYSLGNGNYVIDNYDDTNAAVQTAAAAMSRGGLLSMAEDDSGGAIPMLSFSTNGLWLDITGVTNNLAYLDLYNATNQVYEILTKTDLSLTSWTIEDEVWPTNSTKMPLNIAELGRTNLFAWAMDWTGVTGNGNTTPDWWFWEYFGTVDLSDTNLDTTGDITLLYDYQHGRNPNVIQFSLLFTNISFSTNVVNGSISLEAGVPAYEAVLINDTNTADAVWEPYSSTNLTVILPGNGTCGVEVGLKGFAPNATPIWQTISLTCLNPDAFPLVLSITNPAGSTVSVPVIQLQGLVNKGLSNLVYDISNANGVITSQAGYWQPSFYDTNLLAFTTNAFQCYDISLATGLNTITLHATDVAGNTITTNISYTLDYSSDHTAPVLSLIRPPNGAVIAGSNATVQAQIDDATATVSAVINGVTNQALVERNGTVWFNNLALTSGTNALTITATDAAGNMSTTNLNIIKSSVSFTINPLTAGQLNQPSVTVTGTIGDSSENVSVNGVSATVSGNNWSAVNVPVSDIGTAALSAQVTDSGNNPLAIQTVYQPQPATVVVEAYEQTYRDVDTGYLSWDLDTGPVLTADFKTYWTSGNGLNYGYYQGWVGEAGYPVTTTPFADDLSGYTNDLPVAWEEGDSLIASDSDTQVFHAKTTLALQPAGQDPPGAQRSYLVLVGAQEYGPLLDYNITDLLYPETFLDEVAYTPLSPEQLQVNGQTATDTGITDSNGLTWGLVVVNGPSGASLPLTPAATLSNQNDAAVFQMEVTNLQITANGNPLDPNDLATNAAFVVGQAVTFAISTNLPPGIIATNFLWSFQGNYFNSQSNAVPTLSFPACSTVPYIDSNLLSLEQTTNWWVSGGLNPPSNYIASLTCTLMFTNGNSQEYRTQGQFSMLRPLATFYGQIVGDVEVGTNYWIGSTNTGDTYLHFGINHDSSNVGIALIYVNAPLMPNSTNTYGQYFVTQVIDNYTVRYNIISNNTCAGFETNDIAGLDKSTPYGTGPSQLEASGWPDSPGQQLTSASWLFETNSFTSHLMFLPFPTNGSVAVPLGKVQWNWFGSATNYPWGLESGSPSVYSATTGEDFPYWTHVISGIDTFPQHMHQTNCFPEN